MSFEIRSIARGVLFVAGLLGAACSPDSSASSPDDSPVTHTAAELPSCASDAARVPGVYNVPVSPALAAYASFPLDRVEFCSDDSEVSLSYDLPELLVGNARRVSFRGRFDAQSGTYPLAGNDGSADCTVSSDEVTCDEQFRQSEVDATALDRRLAELPQDEATARQNVAATFGTDPIGVLTFSLTPE